MLGYPEYKMLKLFKYLNIPMNNGHYRITTKFCICHDSTAVVAYSKFRSDSVDKTSNTGNWILVEFVLTITKLRSLELLIKTPLLHILYYINGLTLDFWTRTGGWEFHRSHGAGTSSPSH